jgi:hypothetical protein
MRKGSETVSPLMEFSLNNKKNILAVMEFKKIVSLLGDRRTRMVCELSPPPAMPIDLKLKHQKKKKRADFAIVADPAFVAVVTTAE